MPFYLPTYLSYPTLPYPTQSYPTLPCPTLSYSILLVLFLWETLAIQRVQENFSDEYILHWLGPPRVENSKGWDMGGVTCSNCTWQGTRMAAIAEKSNAPRRSQVSWASFYQTPTHLYVVEIVVHTVHVEVWILLFLLILEPHSTCSPFAI